MPELAIGQVWMRQEGSCIGIKIIEIDGNDVLIEKIPIGRAAFYRDMFNRMMRPLEEIVSADSDYFSVRIR